MATNEFKTVSLDTMIDRHIGKIGTERRDAFENELRIHDQTVLPVDKITRRQLTLFVDKAYSGVLENIRKAFNPKQYDLIDCHVTLCREDEIESMDPVGKTSVILSFDTISLIEQVDGGRWQILKTFRLNKS